MKNTHDAMEAALIASLGAEIDGERNRRRLTQEEVWTRAGISKSAYLKIENGQPGVARTIDQIAGIARALGLSAGELIARAERAAAEAVAEDLPGATDAEKEDLRRAIDRARPRRIHKVDKASNTGT